jgi:hypothetical protein
MKSFGRKLRSSMTQEMRTVVVNRYKEPFEVDIGRGSKWGNPYSHEPKSRAKFIVKSRAEAVRLFRYWILGQPHLLADLGELKGKILGCYCLPKACHGEILAELADNFDPDILSSDDSAFW